MNNKQLIKICLIVLFISSCASSYNFQKRRYRPGFYFHSVGLNKDIEPVKLSSDGPTKIKREKSSPEEVIQAVNPPGQVLRSYFNPKRPAAGQKYLGGKRSGTREWKVSEHKYPNLKSRDEDPFYGEKLKKRNKIAFIVFASLFLISSVVVLPLIISLILLAVAFLFHTRSWKYALRAKSEPEQRGLKRKSRNSRIMAWIFFVPAVLFYLLFLFSVVNIPWVLCLLTLGLGALALALVYNVKWHRFKLKSLAEPIKKPEDQLSQEEIYSYKAKQNKRKCLIFTILSALVLISCIFLPPISALLLLTLPFAIIYRFKWRKYDRLFRKKEIEAEKKKERNLEDEQKSEQAYALARESLLLLLIAFLLTLLSVFGGFLTALGSEAIPLYVIFLGGGIGSLLVFFQFLKKAWLGARYGNEVLDKHPGERYYPAYRKSKFARKVGIFSFVTLPFALLLILGFIIISVSIFL